MSILHVVDIKSRRSLLRWLSTNKTATTAHTRSSRCRDNFRNTGNRSYCFRSQGSWLCVLVFWFYTSNINSHTTTGEISCPFFTSVFPYGRGSFLSLNRGLTRRCWWRSGRHWRLTRRHWRLPGHGRLRSTHWRLPGHRRLFPTTHQSSYSVCFRSRDRGHWLLRS